MVQLGHVDTLARMQHIPTDLVLFLCGVSDENLGLIMRVADIFSVKAVYYYGQTTDVQDKKLQRISRGSQVPVHFTKTEEPLELLRQNGYSIVSLEITDNSIPLRTAYFPTKMCLVSGNERSGVPQSILDKSDYATHIEMIGGHISSLNVAISTSIAVNKYVEQMLFHKLT